MKKLYFFFTAVALLVAAQKTQAQQANSNGFDQLLKSGPGDATKLVNAYGLPLFKGFGTGINGGWNYTAKTKSLLRFELNVTASLALVPSSDKSFDVTKIGLSNHVVPANASQTITPTFAGSTSATRPTLNIKDDNGNTVSSFQMPAGQISSIPAPTVQLTVGLVKNTDVTLRAIPEINVGKDVGKVSMIGFGIKHNIIQDFAGAGAKLIPFDLALAFGYNRLNYSKGLEVKPETGAQPVNAQQSTDFSGQRIDGHLSGINVSAIFSKTFLIFTPFVSIGYQHAKTNIDAIGNYPVTSSASILGQKYYTTYSNPVSINQTSISGVRADVGFQLKLSVFRLYGSYSVGSYQSVNGGIGLGI